MSALASSASPAASPRSSAYGSNTKHSYKRSSSSATTPRSPVTNALTASPVYNSTGATGFRASGAAQRAGVPPPQPQQNREFVDAGTQYSPEGYPPTASTNRDSTTVGSKTNKRKQSSPSPSMGATAAPASPPSGSALNTAPVADNSNAPRTEPQQNGDAVDSVASSTQSAVLVVSEVRPKRPRKDANGARIMPRKYETCDAKDLGVLIADMLMELIRLNDKIPLRDGKLTRFHSRAPPGISVHDYLSRLIQHATLSPPIMLSMVYYIDRLCALYPAFTIGSLTVHRFLITAATVASKGLSDSFWTNPTYARIGGISTSELATLELDFLQRVQFRIVPKAETLVEYYMSLVQRSQDYELEEDSPEVADVDAMDEDQL